MGLAFLCTSEQELFCINTVLIGHLNAERSLFWQKLIGDNDGHCGSQFSLFWSG